MKDKGHLLFGILNWGLGHASRSVPIIEAARQEGYQPVLCSDGEARAYLQQEFPDLPMEEMPTYNVWYGSKSLLWQVLWQLPSIYRTINAENAAVKTLVEKYQPAGIISDNRLGFYYKSLPSVYITHQLHMPLPYWLQGGNPVHQYFLSKFHRCWVPDLQAKNNLAGKMSRPKIGLKREYIGPLSRFMAVGERKEDKPYRAVAILSGPEPQRSILEKKLLQQMESLEGRFALVRGRPGEELLPSSVEVYNLLSGSELARLIAGAEIVISRSGYSSIMDYYFLGNKALLIPTPGQPEQEYLARLHMQKGNFRAVSQKKLDLSEDLPKALEYPGLMAHAEPYRDWPELFGFFQGK